MNPAEACVSVSACVGVCAAFIGLSGSASLLASLAAGRDGLLSLAVNGSTGLDGRLPLLSMREVSLTSELMAFSASAHSFRALASLSMPGRTAASPSWAALSRSRARSSTARLGSCLASSVTVRAARFRRSFLP